VSPKPPQLPKIKEINHFITVAAEVIKLPTVKKGQTARDTGSLKLEDLLEEPTILDLSRLPELIALGLELLPRIDSRFFEHRSELRAPYDCLKEEAEIAKDLVGALNSSATLCGRVYTNSFEDTVRRMMVAVDFHRGDALTRRVEGLDVSSKLVILEMCYDGGVVPKVEIPDIGMYHDIDKQGPKRQAYGELSEEKPTERKKLNYGRPESKRQDTDVGSNDEESILARRKEKTNRDVRIELDRENAEDLHKGLHASAVEEVKAFVSRVRKASTKHTQFGTLMISSQEANERDNLSAQKEFNASLTPWIQHAISVHEANIDKAEVKPYLQGVAEQLVRVACKVITYSELALRNRAIRSGKESDGEGVFDSRRMQNWSLGALKTSMKESLSWYRAYAHVIEVMEAVAPVAERTGLGKMLPEKDRRLVQRMAPAVTPVAPDDNPIFEKYLANREELALDLKVEMLARTIVAQNTEPGLSQYPEEGPERLTFARELAMKRLKEGKR